MKKQWILCIMGFYFLQSFVAGIPASADSYYEKFHEKQWDAIKDQRKAARESAKARAALLEGDYSDARRHARRAAKERREYLRHSHEANRALMRQYY